MLCLRSARADQVSGLMRGDPGFEGLRLPQTPPILNTDVYDPLSLYTGAHTPTRTWRSALNVDRGRPERVCWGGGVVNNVGPCYCCGDRNFELSVIKNEGKSEGQCLVPRDNK